VASEVRMPQLGLTMTEGLIVHWLVAEGDHVAKGQPLAEIETDKIVTDLESPGEGIVREIMVKEGDIAAVAGLLAVIAALGEDYSPVPGPEHPPSPDGNPKVASSTPTAESSPLDTERHRASPYARRLARDEGIDLDKIPSGTGARGRVVGSDVLAAAKSTRRSQTPSTPVAPRIAAEAGKSLDMPAGSGPGGRITREDVEQPAAVSRPTPLEVVPMTGVRGVIAARMAESARTAAAVTLTTEADATDLAELRDRLSDRRGEGEQTRVPFDAILVKIASIALRQHPRLNALLAGDEIQVMRDVDIAVAVDTERGLLTPVVRKADTKGIFQVAGELAELAGRARLGKSQPEDLEGGTFTITNLGMHEIDAFTPIINPPQCAVLGVGRICTRPAVRGDGLCIRKTVWLSLTFDHRMVDGAPAARFLQCVRQYVEQPGGILD